MKNLSKEIAFLVLIMPFCVNAQTEIKISKDSLPLTIKEHLLKRFHNYSITTTVKTTSQDGTVTYKIDARKEKSSNQVIIYNLTYDVNGKLTDKEKDKEFSYDSYDSKDKEQSKECKRPPIPPL